MMGRGMMDGTRVVGFVMRLAGVLDIGNVARVSVIDVVGHSLKTTVGELNMVLALGGVAITALSGTKVEAVLISDTVLVGVMGSSGLIVGLMVSSVDRGMNRDVMNWGMVDNRGVDWSVVGNSHSSKDSSEDEVLNWEETFFSRHTECNKTDIKVLMCLSFSTPLPHLHFDVIVLVGSTDTQLPLTDAFIVVAPSQNLPVTVASMRHTPAGNPR